MSTPQLPPGTVVDSRFTVGNAVRTRDGATVYDATDAHNGGDPCSLTIYDAACFPSGLVLERSLRELRQLQSVVSHRILPALGAGKWGDGAAWEACGAMPPHTLTDTIAAGPLSLPDAAALVVQIGEALLEAQRAGVIHRSLGGDVIFPSPQGVKVTGFAVGEPQGGPSFGSLPCIAPEQVQGKVVDQRTLIYNVAALMHWMLTGAPLFGGDRQQILQQHDAAEPPPHVHDKLRRALGKDPRMRPMMLKQFLGEVAQAGGVEPPKAATRVPPMVKPAVKPTAPPPVATPSAGVAPPLTEDGRKPSSRGWTMFMKAQDDDAGASPSPAPPPAAEESKPSTRGWTMFMKTQEEGGAEQPASSEPAQPAPPTGDEVQPSTRGWTMFMHAQDGGDEAKPAASEEPARPAPSAPVTGDEVQPSTRGWTMFMKEADQNRGQSAQEGAAEHKPATPPVAQPAAGEPTTRGWTMFMKESGEQPADAPDAPAPAATPAALGARTQQTPVQGSGAAPIPAPPEHGTDAPPQPTARGWTMFTDSGHADAQPPAVTPSTPTVPDGPKDAPEAGMTVAAGAGSAPPAVAGDAAADAGSGPQKKRGWTMFMDAPIADLAKAAPAPEPQPEPTDKGASDKKGWTVFGEPSPLAKSAAEPEPTPAPAGPGAARGGAEGVQTTKTAMFGGPLDSPRDAELPIPSAAGHTGAPGQAAGAVSSETPPAKTVIAASMQQGPTGSVTGRTGEQARDTMYSMRGATEPEVAGRGASPRAPTARDVGLPLPADVVARAADAPRPTTLPPPTKSGGSPMVLYVVIGVIVLGGLGTAAFFAFW